MHRVFFILLFLWLAGCAPPGHTNDLENAAEASETSSPTAQNALQNTAVVAGEAVETPDPVSNAASSSTRAAIETTLRPIQLQSRTFVPEPGVETAVHTLQQNSQSAQQLHILIQFADIPTDAERQAMQNAGVFLLEYVPQNSWFVSVPVSLDLQSDPLGSALYIGQIQPADRLDPVLVELLDADTAGTVTLHVRFFSDVPSGLAEKQLLDQGAAVLDSLPDFSRYTVQIPQSKVGAIAEMNDVQWITNAAPPKTTDGE